MDGTFQVAGIFQQLYVIHGNIFEHNRQTYPLVFAFCSNKDKSTYTKLFEAIIDYCSLNNIELKVQNVIIDFEITAMQIMKRSFEHVTINGCFFHLGQIIFGRVQKNGKSVLYGTNIIFCMEIKCLLALAFLEPSEIALYFTKLQEESSPDAVEIINKFGEDFVLSGINKSPKYSSDIWSIANLESRGLPRTQNSAESWHHRFNLIVD